MFDGTKIETHLTRVVVNPPKGEDKSGSKKLNIRLSLEIELIPEILSGFPYSKTLLAAYAERKEDDVLTVSLKPNDHVANYRGFDGMDFRASVCGTPKVRYNDSYPILVYTAEFVGETSSAQKLAGCVGEVHELSISLLQQSLPGTEAKPPEAKPPTVRKADGGADPALASH